MTTPIAVQLYTLREEAAADFPAVLARLGRIGYRGVELAGLHDLTPADLLRQLGDAGLEIASAHAIPLGDDANAVLDEQEALGNRTLVVPFQPPKRFRDLDALKGVADALNEANANARSRGMRLGYHNHFWEFQNQIDGRPAFEVLFDLVEPEIFAEVDIYWAQVGGVDPAAAIERLGDRARLLHVKDGPADEPASDMTAVGDGKVDIPGILAAAPSAEWHIVELDRCATDMFEAVEASHRYLVGQGLSAGAERDA